MLENETKKMEEKLDLVKKMMELEKEKRSQIQNSKDGSIWRGATTKKNIKGYSDAVITHHKKNQQNLPPTTLVTETRSSKLGSQGSQRSFKQTPTSQTKNFIGNQNIQQKSTAPSGIVNNFNNALTSQNEEYGEVKIFLESIKLDKYFDKLIDNGVEDLETILELQDSHVEQMGVPLGHKLKMMKRIKDLR